MVCNGLFGCGNDNNCIWTIIIIAIIVYWLGGCCGNNCVGSCSGTGCVNNCCCD